GIDIGLYHRAVEVFGEGGITGKVVEGSANARNSSVSHGEHCFRMCRIKGPFACSKCSHVCVPQVDIYRGARCLLVSLTHFYRFPTQKNSRFDILIEMSYFHSQT